MIRRSIYVYISLSVPKWIFVHRFIANQRFQEFFFYSEFCNDDVLGIDFYFRHFMFSFELFAFLRSNAFVVRLIFTQYLRFRIFFIPFVFSSYVPNDAIAWIRVEICICVVKNWALNNKSLGQNFDVCANIPMKKKLFTSKFNYHKVSFGWDLKKRFKKWITYLFVTFNKKKIQWSIQKTEWVIKIEWRKNKLMRRF